MNEVSFLQTIKAIIGYSLAFVWLDSGMHLDVLSEATLRWIHIATNIANVFEFFFVADKNLVTSLGLYACGLSHDGLTKGDALIGIQYNVRCGDVAALTLYL